MPLFSNRSLAQLFHELGDSLPTERRNDILSRLVRGGIGAIGAEWEVVVFACLKRKGDLEFLEKRKAFATRM